MFYFKPSYTAADTPCEAKLMEIRFQARVANGCRKCEMKWSLSSVSFGDFTDFTVCCWTSRSAALNWNLLLLQHTLPPVSPPLPWHLFASCPSSTESGDCKQAILPTSRGRCLAAVDWRRWSLKKKNRYRDSRRQPLFRVWETSGP